MPEAELCACAYPPPAISARQHGRIRVSFLRSTCLPGGGRRGAPFDDVHCMKMTTHTLMSLTGALVLLLLLGCRSASSSKDVAHVSEDAKLRQRITGNWTLSLDDDVKSRIVFGSHGDYACKVIGSDGKLIAQLEGTFEIKDGFLVETVLKDSQTDATVPRTSRAAIVRTGAQELVLTRADTGNEVVLRKESK